MIELNPLDVLNSRQLKTMPPHFSKTKIGNSERTDQNIVDWIKSKLTGRYCVVSYPSVNDENRFHTSTFVGFEEQKELTYFMLACPYLRRN
jgi:hypothetical protein